VLIQVCLRFRADAFELDVPALDAATANGTLWHEEPMHQREDRDGHDEADTDEDIEIAVAIDRGRGVRHCRQ